MNMREGDTVASITRVPRTDKSGKMIGDDDLEVISEDEAGGNRDGGDGSNGSDGSNGGSSGSKAESIARMPKVATGDGTAKAGDGKAGPQAKESQGHHPAPAEAKRSKRPTTPKAVTTAGTAPPKAGPEAKKTAPAKAASPKAAVAKATPTKAASAKATPVKATPAKAASAKAVSAKAGPAKATTLNPLLCTDRTAARVGSMTPSAANNTTTRNRVKAEVPATAKASTAKPSAAAKPNTAAKPSTTTKPSATAKATTAKPTAKNNNAAKPSAAKPTLEKTGAAKLGSVKPAPAKPAASKPAVASPVVKAQSKQKPANTVASESSPKAKSAPVAPKAKTPGTVTARTVKEERKVAIGKGQVSQNQKAAPTAQAVSRARAGSRSAPPPTG